MVRKKYSIALIARDKVTHKRVDNSEYTMNFQRIISEVESSKEEFDRFENMSNDLKTIIAQKFVEHINKLMITNAWKGTTNLQAIFRGLENSKIEKFYLTVEPIITIIESPMKKGNGYFHENDEYYKATGRVELYMNGTSEEYLDFEWGGENAFPNKNTSFYDLIESLKNKDLEQMFPVVKTSFSKWNNGMGDSGNTGMPIDYETVNFPLKKIKLGKNITKRVIEHITKK